MKIWKDQELIDGLSGRGRSGERKGLHRYSTAQTCMREKTGSTPNATWVVAAGYVNRLSASTGLRFRIRRNPSGFFMKLMSFGKAVVFGIMMKPFVSMENDVR